MWKEIFSNRCARYGVIAIALFLLCFASYQFGRRSAVHDTSRVREISEQLRRAEQTQHNIGQQADSIQDGAAKSEREAADIAEGTKRAEQAVSDAKTANDRAGEIISDCQRLLGEVRQRGIESKAKD